MEWAKKSLGHPSAQWPIHACLVSTLGYLGRRDEASKALEDLQRIRPGISITFVRENHPNAGGDYREYLLEGLRKAGLPE